MKGGYSESKFFETIAAYQYQEKVFGIFQGIIILLTVVVFFIHLGLLWETKIFYLLNSSTTSSGESEKKTGQQPSNSTRPGNSGENPDDKKKTWWQRHWKKVLAGTTLSVILVWACFYYGDPNILDNLTGKNVRDYQEVADKLEKRRAHYPGVFCFAKFPYWPNLNYHLVPYNFRIISTQTEYLVDLLKGHKQYPYYTNIGVDIILNHPIPVRNGPGLLEFAQKLNYAWVNHFLIVTELEMLAIKAQANFLGLKDLTLLQNYAIYEYMDNIHSTVMSGNSCQERERILLNFLDSEAKYREFRNLCKFSKGRVDDFPSYRNFLLCWVNDAYKHLVKTGVVEDLGLDYWAGGLKLEIILSQESGVKLEIGK